MEFIIAIISGGIGGGLVRYILDTRKAKREYAIKLHREWWSAKFSQRRSEVYKIVEDLHPTGGHGPDAEAFLRHVKDRTVLQHPSGRSFFQIAFFFADINACLDKKLLDADFTYRLFGASQYYWFQPLIEEVRKNLPNQTDDIRWKWETKELEKKFDPFREKDIAKKNKLLSK